MQHDVCEFYAFVSQKLAPVLTAGEWIARLRDEDGIHEVERGSTLQPIQLLNPRLTHLDAMVHDWMQQRGLQALATPPSILAIALPRFQESSAGYVKTLAPMQVLQPFLSFPAFTGHGLTLQSLQYRLCACLIHDGLTQHSGHYRVILSAANDAWFLKDDHRPVALLTYCQAQALCESRGYLLLYCRADDHAVSSTGIA